MLLQEVNDALQQRHAAGQLPVLSLGEGRPLSIAGLPLRMVVVPPEAANPGYGSFMVLPEADHIDVCKPCARADPAYALVASFLHQCTASAAQTAVDVAEADAEHAHLPYAS